MFAARQPGEGLGVTSMVFDPSPARSAPTRRTRSKRLKSLVKICGAGMALAAFTIPFAGADAASGVPFTNSNVDKVYGAGSDTTYPLMNDLATVYGESDGCLLTAVAFPLTVASPKQNSCRSGTGAAISGDNVYENYDHDVIVNYFPQGSGQGRGQLCNQKSSTDGGPDKDSRVPYLDFARSSAAPNSSFQCTVAAGGETPSTLRFIAFARDAISYTHWNTATGGGGAVNNLTTAQLRDIFINCTVTDWGQVGGVAGKPIVVWTAVPGSGTRSTFEGFIGGGDSSACIPAAFKDGNFANGERVIRENEMEPIESALNDPAAADEGNSISFMSVGLHNSDPGRAGASLIGDVNSIVPDETNIVSGTFPFSRNLYNVIRNSGVQPVASGATRRFLGMVTSTATNGQSVGWICKGEQYHSEQVGNPSPVGIEDPTATRDWYEAKKAQFAANGVYQLTPDAFGNRCTFSDVATV
jgi:ABC-type phosphate transport system substrate-binding protein